MKLRANQPCRWIGVLAISFAMYIVAGCDNSDFDHDPPAGQGSLIVDNFTGDRVRVYIDGEEAQSVS